MPSAFSPADSLSPDSSLNRLLVFQQQMKDEIDQIIERATVHEELITNLKQDLSVTKRAYSGLEAENKSLVSSSQDLAKQCNILQNQLKPNRLVVLIDGDGAIFNPDLIAEGLTGGHNAASQLSESVKQYLPGRSQHQLSVYAFLNKRGLADTFGKISNFAAKQKLDDFIVGFNQASQRFIMVDVGNAKEAADTKIKALLETEIRFPQTDRVIFGGCHDNGYTTTLRSHITSGFKDKIILLQSYDEIAAGITALNLPVLTIPGLFLAEKLNINTQLESPLVFPMDLPPIGQTPPRSSVLGSASWSTIGRRRASSHARSDSAKGPGLGSAPTSPAQRPASLAVAHRGRKIDRSVYLWKQDPPACTIYYVSPFSCHNADCIYSHEYEFSDADIAELAKNTKTVPCKDALKGNPCQRGDECIYGHKCPNLGRCSFLRVGKCRFTAKGMHTPDEDD